MTPDQRFALLMVLLSATIGGLGWLVRTSTQAIAKWAHTEDQLAGLAEDIKELVLHKEADHAELKERLTWLERRELDQRRRDDTQ